MVKLKKEYTKQTKKEKRMQETYLLYKELKVNLRGNPGIDRQGEP